VLSDLGSGVTRSEGLSGLRLLPGACAFCPPLRSTIFSFSMVFGEMGLGVSRPEGVSGHGLVAGPCVFSAPSRSTVLIFPCLTVLGSDGCGVLRLWEVSGRELDEDCLLSKRLRWAISSDDDGLFYQDISLRTFKDAFDYVACITAKRFVTWYRVGCACSAAAC
jgi:hypothetical protein